MTRSVVAPSVLPLTLALLQIQYYVDCMFHTPTYKGALNNLGNALKEGDLFDEVRV